MVPLNILVVDDEETVLRAITELLESHGFRTLQASNGRDALQLLKGSPPPLIDAVLLDRTMPGLDGWATLQEMSRLRPRLPVILCSGYLSNEDQKAGDAAPAATLQKPFYHAAIKYCLAKKSHANGSVFAYCRIDRELAIASCKTCQNARKHTPN